MPPTTLHEPEVNLELALGHGLTEEEYGWILERLGRLGNTWLMRMGATAFSS